MNTKPSLVLLFFGRALDVVLITVALATGVIILFSAADKLFGSPFGFDLGFSPWVVAPFFASIVVLAGLSYIDGLSERARPPG